MERVGPEMLAGLFDRHGAALVLFARQFCRSPEDVVQEAFLALARQKAVPERPVAWLHRAVRNGAIDARRRSSRSRDREERAAEPEAWFERVDDAIDARSAAALLAELDEEVREVVVARLWGGLTFEEIARLQGGSLTTVHRRYQAGISRLQTRLERPCPTTSSATS